MNSGFPELTDSFLSGQDILYTQFNDIEFFVEDTDQEHFYFNILKKLFADLKFEKIFPLNGKENVCENANLNIGNKKKVYIVDLDFDHLLDAVVNLDNLFYLKRYSIENYLFSKGAIYEVIRNRHPKLKNEDIDPLLDLNKIILDTACLKELSCCFIIIQDKELGHPYYGINVTRDFNFNTSPPTYRMNFIGNYIKDVEILLKAKDKRYSLASQKRNLIKHFKTASDCLANIPGKYLLTFLKNRLFHHGLINQMTDESFTYSLSKDFNGDELIYLRTNITNYIQ